MTRWSTGWIGLALSACAAGALAQDSGVFTQQNANVFIVHPQTGESTPLSLGRWVDNYAEGEVSSSVPLTDPRQALVNALPASSTRMRSGQPAVSITGLGAVGANAMPADVRLLPPSGSALSATTEVFFGIREDLLDAGAIELRWTVNGQSACTLSLPRAQASDSCRAPIVRRDGYVGSRVFLVAEGSHQVDAAFFRSASRLASVLGQYTLDTDHPDGARRDSNADGIPDAIAVAIGLDPLSGDLAQDRDGDGWSDLDEWLRCPLPLDADGRCAAADDPDLVPLDSDEDGWSDVDETLRGTRTDDPEPVLIPQPGEAADDDSLAARRLRFKEFPAARSLYEVEVIVQAPLVESAPGRWTRVDAFDLAGRSVYDSTALLTDEEITAASLALNSVAPRLRQTEAEGLIGSGQVPGVRLPVGRGAMLTAQRLLDPGATRVLKQAFGEEQEATPQRFGRTNPAWTTPADWQQAALAWLQDHLTIPQDTAVDAASTLVALGLEAVLTGEAARWQSQQPVIFSPSRQPLAIPFLTDLQQTLAAQVEAPPLEVAAQGGLSLLLERLALALPAGGVAADVGAFFSARMQSTPAGLFSDDWVAAGLRQSVDPETQGCFVFSEFVDSRLADPDFATRCPQFYTEQDVLNWQREDAARRYRLRLLAVLPPAAIAADARLQDPLQDPDGDGLASIIEIDAQPLPLATRPDRFDTDADGLDDFVDPCPLDPLNGCDGTRDLPVLRFGLQAVVIEMQDGAALVSLQLDRVAERAVRIELDIRMAEGDTAEPGSDFIAGTVVVDIAAGEQFAVVRIPISDDMLAEGEETFSVILVSVDGAVAADDRLTIRIRDPLVDAPTAIALGPGSVDERATAMLNGASSSDPASQGLSFAWQQLAGPVGDGLEDADQAIARYLAPEVLQDQQVTFRLTVTAANGQIDTADLQLTVRAVEDPPELLGTVLASVVAGEELFLPAEDIYAQVREPDGQPLTLDRLIGAPLDRGTFMLELGGLRFASLAPAASALEVLTMRDTILRPNGPDAVALALTDPGGGPEEVAEVFIAFRGDVPERIHASDPDFGRTPDLRGDPVNRVLYFDGINNSTQVFVPGEGVRSLAEPLPSASRSAIDQVSGDLYFCRSGIWVAIDAQTAALRTAGESCNSTFTFRSVQAGERLCFAEDNRVFCTTPMGTVQLVIPDLPGNVRRLYALNNDPLALVNNPVRDQLLGYSPTQRGIGFEDQSQIESAALDHFGILIFPVEETFSPGDETLRLKFWEGGNASSFEPFSARIPWHPIQVVGNQQRGGALTSRDEAIYWYVVDGVDRYALYRMDWQPGDDLPVEPRRIATIETRTSSTPLTIEPDPLGVRLMRSRPSNGQCDWLRVRDDGEIEVLIEEIDCRVPIRRGNLHYVQRINIDDGSVSVFTVAEDSSLDPVEFAVEVSDTAANALSVPVRIEVSAPLPSATPTPEPSPPLTGATGGSKSRVDPGRSTPHASGTRP